MKLKRVIDMVYNPRQVAWIRYFVNDTEIESVTEENISIILDYDIKHPEYGITPLINAQVGVRTPGTENSIKCLLTDMVNDVESKCREEYLRIYFTEANIAILKRRLELLSGLILIRIEKEDYNEF